MFKKTNTPATEILENYIFSKEVEIERLSYFEALFKTIRTDITNKGHSAKALASLGEYLTQDFIHYSESELDDLMKSKGADDE